jgi:hypothetical protein
MLQGLRVLASTRLPLGACALLTVVCLGASIAVAQGATGRLAGTVVDSRGDAIAGARVDVTSDRSSAVRRVTTTGDGAFAAEFLPPGRYTVTVSASGFGTTEFVDVAVRIAETTPVTCELSPALDAESVTVTAEAALLQPTSAQLGRVVEQEQIRALPLPTRNYLQLLSLSPGTVTGLSNNTELGRGDATVSVNGQRATSNNVRMNGVDANAIAGNATLYLAVPAADAIEEFVVLTSLYDATNGRGVGGNVDVVTRSGSNAYHGGVYEYFRNRALNANDFFLNAAGRPRPVLDRHQFGGRLGGPILRDKLFFFLSYQGTRERNGASLLNSLSSPTIPPSLRDDNRTPAGLSGAFGVPEGEVSPIAVALLSARLPSGEYAVPSPTTPSGLTPLSTVSTFRENQYNANVDILPTDNHAIAVKWFFASNPSEEANASNDPTQLPGFGSSSGLTNRLLAVSDTWEIAPTVVNQLRFGLSRNRLESTPVEPFTAAQFGISTPLQSQFPGMPTIAVVGLFTLGSSPFVDSDITITTYTLADTVSVSLGRHRIRFGGEYRRARTDLVRRVATRGQLVFPTFDSFLRGQSFSVIGSGVFDRSLRVDDVSWFIQDDVRVSDRLSLNFGVRHDYYGPTVDALGRLVNFLPEDVRLGTPSSPALPPNGFVQAGNAASPLPGVPLVEDGIIRGDWNNLSPRVGLAWRPFESDRIVLRGGYGIYHDRVSMRWAVVQMQSYPYYTLASAAGRPFSEPFAPVLPPSAFPLLPTIPSPLQAPINGIFIDPDFRTPIVQQYGANVQWELASGLLLEAGYVGAKGSKLFQYVSLNQPVYDPATGQFVAPLGPYLSTQKNPGGGVQQVQTSGRSRFDSFQASLTKRFADGLQFLASYTLGRSTDTHSGAATNDLIPIVGDQSDPLANQGRSDYDRRHRFVASFVYDLPIPSGPMALRAALGGWRVAGIVTLQSGLPFSVVDNPNNFVIQRANRAPGAGDGALAGDVQDRLGRYFDTGAYVASRQFLAPGVPNPYFDPAAPFGNTERNLLTGPAARNVDLSVARSLDLSERVELELRCELFNAFNWVNFANPNANIAVAPTFGRVTATAGGPRIIQLAAKLAF